MSPPSSAGAAPASSRSDLARTQPEPQRREAPEPRHLRVAPDVRRRRRRARLLVFVSCVVTVASLFTLVAFHVLAAQSAFTLDHVTTERNNEQLRYQRLRDEVARASSPAQVIAEAQQLGMIPASQVHDISAPAAAPVGTTPDAVPQSLSPGTYGQAKKALDSNP